MLKNRKIIVALILMVSLSWVSCRKFLDVNQNPNVSPTTTLKILLPAAQLYAASAVGVDLQVYGSFWAQYWTQYPGSTYYKTFDQYTPTQDLFNNSWTNLYAACENFYQLQILADSLNQTQYTAIALLMQAYCFEAITDGWGDVPYKQALKGQYINGHLVSPKFDSQLVVYKGILNTIDSAIKLISVPGTVIPNNEDLIYQGNMTKWRKFGLTLKLRTILRMSQIDPINAQADMIILYNTPGLAFIGTGDDAAIKFGSSTTNNNPLYSEQIGIAKQNFVASNTCIDSMLNNYDTMRMKVFYEAGTSGFYSGITQGDFNTALTSYSIPNVYVAGDVKNSNSGNAQVNLLTCYESLFLQAEVVARGWVSPGLSDATLFYQAVQANFDYYNTQLVAAAGVSSTIAYANYIAGGAPATLYPIGGSVGQKVKYIILQKWYAMCGNQSFEAWTELRRTGLDSMLLPSISSQIGNQLPKRFIYPSAESINNTNFPGLQPITAKVWWDLY